MEAKSICESQGVILPPSTGPKEAQRQEPLPTVATVAEAVERSDFPQLPQYPHPVWDGSVDSETFIQRREAE